MTDQRQTRAIVDQIVERMPYVVHSHVEQAVAQCDAAHLTRMNAMQKQINALEGYLHAMFGSIYEEEM